MAVGGGSGGAGSAAIKAGQAVVVAKLDSGPLESGLKAAQKLVLGWGAKVAGVGAGFTAASAVIAGPILAAMTDAAGRFNDVRKAADQLGTTPEIFSGLAFAVNRFGVDSEGLVTAGRHMDRFIASAMEGGAAADTFKTIGLNAQDLVNLPLDQQFEAIADGISRLGTEAERQAATIDIFGRSAGNLAPLMREGAKGITDLIGKAKDIGAIVTQEDAATAKKYSAALNEIKYGFKFLVEAIGAAALPEVADGLRQVADFIVPVIKGARGLIEENRGVVTAVLAVGAALGAAGAALIAIGSLLAAAAVAVGGFVSALSAAGAVLAVVFSPVGLGIAALSAAGVALAAIVAELVDLNEVADTFGFVWAGVAETFDQTWSGIVAALKGGDLKAAWEIGLAGLDVAWQAFQVVLLEGWNLFKETFVDGWHDVVLSVRKLWEDLVTAIAVGIAESMAALRAAVGDTAGAQAWLDKVPLMEEANRLEKARLDMVERRAKAERDAFRAGASDAQLKQLQAARDALAGKSIDARLNQMDAFGNFDFGDRGPAAASLISAGTRGAFAGTNLGAELSVGQADTQKKIEKNTSDTALNTKKLADDGLGLKVD